MRICWIAGLLLCGSDSLAPSYAQAVDTSLEGEVAAVRAELARSIAALQHYTWTERVEVFVKGDLEQSTVLNCRYDDSGDLNKTPVATPKEQDKANGISRRPIVRKKADMQDYIERAIKLITNYVPPKPGQIEYALKRTTIRLAGCRKTVPPRSSSRNIIRLATQSHSPMTPFQRCSCASMYRPIS